MYVRQAAVLPLAFLLLALNAACSRAQDPTLAATAIAPVETTTSIFTETPVPATPTPACTESQGTLESRELVSPNMPAPLRFIVYLPPCYGLSLDQRYPVIYLFHGQFYDETQWVQLGVAQVADRLVTSGEIPPFLVILPFDPYPSQPYEYGFDEAFVRDLLPYIDQNYRTIPDRDHRAIGGLSRGSSWALHFGLSRPELFGRFGMHSPVVFSSDGLLVEKWLDIIPVEKMPQIYLDVSENDQNLQNVTWLEDILTSRGIPHEYHLNTGFHTEEYWATHMEEYLRWYSSSWSALP